MRENDIRPEALLNRYVELSAEDAKNCFSGVQRSDIPCVSCGSGEAETLFDKSGFAYAQCLQCGTLFQTPRPSIEAFEAFYRDSESSRYWAEVFFPAVAEIRREKIFRPRVERLTGMVAEAGIEVNTLIDVGAGYGIFLDEWRKRSPQTQLVAIEPSANLAERCNALGFKVVADIVEHIQGYDASADLVTCFEVLEHVYAPLSFIRVLKDLARPGGYVFISTLGIDGFDLQTLWDKSGQISPPHHINFLSVQGFETLFKQAGLTDVRVTTPGQLDVDIVRNAQKRYPDLLCGNRFLQHLLDDNHRAEAFQGFLAENQLSSHTWVIGKKPGVGEETV